MREERILREKRYKRELIISAAKNLFYEKGVKDTSVDQIAKESGFTKKTVYNYFKSKDEIYYEVVKTAFQKLHTYLSDTLDMQSNRKSYEKIKNLGEAFVNFNKEFNNDFKLFSEFENTNIEEILKSDTAISIYQEGEFVVKLLQRIIEEGIAKEEIKEDVDVKKVVVLLWGSITGMINLINYKKEYIEKAFELDIYEVLDYSFDVIIKSIRKEG